MTDLLIKLFIKGSNNTKDKDVRTAYGNFACVIGILCNILLFAGKILVGTLFGSVSIAADAINNLMDASSNIVGLIGFKLGNRPADEQHPYGHARYEYLAGLAVSVMIIFMGIELMKSGISKIITPTEVEFSWLTVGVLAASIGIKLWLSFFNTDIGRRINSETLLATAADSRNDSIATSAVLLSSIAILLTGLNVIDGVMGCLVAAFVLYSGIMLVKETLDPILGSAPDPAEIDAIYDMVMSYENVIGIHDLMLHDYGPGNKLLSFHIEMPASNDLLESHDLIDRIEKDLMARFGMIATIHFDPVVTDDPHIEEIRSLLDEVTSRFDCVSAIHDLRIVPGQTHTNVVFDCVVPSEYLSKKSSQAAALIDKMKTAVTERWPDHFCVIQLEHDYGLGKRK